jgi:SecY interacting protein Syd
MKRAMKEFFDRLMKSIADAGGGLPRVARDPDADPIVYQGAPDADDWVAWRPVEKTVRHDLRALAPDLPALHPSLEQYFNAYWFAALEGRVGSWTIALLPVLPGDEPESFLLGASDYAAAHGGRLDHVPIGSEHNGLQVVVDNRTGAVAIEDWERGTFTEIAPSLEELLLKLRP